MIIYDNPAAYLTAAGPDLKARIDRLTVIITNLENMVANTAGGDIQSYNFNDGQSQINTTYKSLNEITAAINAFDGIRQRLINKAQSRITILRDASTRSPIR